MTSDSPLYRLTIITYSSWKAGGDSSSISSISSISPNSHDTVQSQNHEHARTAWYLHGSPSIIIHRLTRVYGRSGDMENISKTSNLPVYLYRILTAQCSENLPTYLAEGLNCRIHICLEAYLHTYLQKLAVDLRLDVSNYYRIRDIDFNPLFWPPPISAIIGSQARKYFLEYGKDSVALGM